MINLLLLTEISTLLHINPKDCLHSENNLLGLRHTDMLILFCPPSTGNMDVNIKIVLSLSVHYFIVASQTEKVTTTKYFFCLRLYSYYFLSNLNVLPSHLFLIFVFFCPIWRPSASHLSRSVVPKIYCCIVLVPTQ